MLKLVQNEFYQRLRTEYYKSHNMPIHNEVYLELTKYFHILAYRYFYVQAPGLIEDAVMEMVGTFMTRKMHIYLSDDFALKYPDEESRGKWVTRISKNMINDIYRRAQVKRDVSSIPEEERRHMVEDPNYDPIYRLKNGSLDEVIGEDLLRWETLVTLDKTTDPETAVFRSNEESKPEKIIRYMADMKSTSVETIITVLFVIMYVFNTDLVKGRNQRIAKRLDGNTVGYNLCLLHALIRKSGFDPGLIAPLVVRIKNEYEGGNAISMKIMNVSSRNVTQRFNNVKLRIRANTSETEAMQE